MAPSYDHELADQKSAQAANELTFSQFHNATILTSKGKKKAPRNVEVQRFRGLEPIGMTAGMDPKDCFQIGPSPVKGK